MWIKFDQTKYTLYELNMWDVENYLLQIPNTMFVGVMVSKQNLYSKGGKQNCNLLWTWIHLVHYVVLDLLEE